MEVTLNALSATLAEFEALPRRTPEEVCAAFLCALHLYLSDKDAGAAAGEGISAPGLFPGGRAGKRLYACKALCAERPA